MNEEEKPPEEEGRPFTLLEVTGVLVLIMGVALAISFVAWGTFYAFFG